MIYAREAIQKLLPNAYFGTFGVVLTEGLYRLSRNRADIASISQKLQFRNVVIETVSEGMMSEIHIGLEGTMNLAFLRTRCF